MHISKRLQIVFFGILGCILFVLAYFTNNDDPVSEDLTELFAWSNDADDGMSAFHTTQHGVTKIISGCDADDPGCLYHMSKNFDYSKSYWTGPSADMNPKDPSNEVYGLMPGVNIVHHLAPEEKSIEEKDNDRRLRDLQDVWRDLENQVEPLKS